LFNFHTCEDGARVSAVGWSSANLSLRLRAGEQTTYTQSICSRHSQCRMASTARQGVTPTDFKPFTTILPLSALHNLS